MLNWSALEQAAGLDDYNHNLFWYARQAQCLPNTPEKLQKRKTLIKKDHIIQL